MNFDFYADKLDKEQLLHFIFNETELHIYDLASSGGEEVRQYRDVESVIGKIQTTTSATYFQMWAPSFSGNVVVRRVDLDPQRCNGHKFRYATDGLGLIQLYFGGEKNALLQKSHIGHFSEKGAIRNEDVAVIKAAQWNWKEIERMSRLLRNTIQTKLSVSKHNGLDVMQGADNLQRNGALLQ